MAGDISPEYWTFDDIRGLVRRHKPEYGWECPRCHQINAPHINHCDCRPNETVIESDVLGRWAFTEHTEKNAELLEG